MYLLEEVLALYKNLQNEYLSNTLIIILKNNFV